MAEAESLIVAGKEKDYKRFNLRVARIRSSTWNW
jgi:hypothetical protein